MDDATKLLYESAADLAKQMMTLSTGVLGVTAAFVKDIAKDATPRAVRSLRLSWLAHLVSLIFGIWVLMAIAGTVGRIASGSKLDHLISFNIRLPALMQVICFLLGIFYVTRFASATLLDNNQTVQKRRRGATE
jgi:ABC-type dipeptide/oligopeptide/nickel transport system permease component